MTDATPVVPHSRPDVSEADIAAVSASLRARTLATGEIRSAFEREAAHLLQQTRVKSAATGTLALVHALASVGVVEGQDVILPTYVCASVADAVEALGATAVLCDVGDDWCLNQETVKAAFSAKTAAIIAVHMFGIAADLDGLLALGVPVIEDCAQSLGGRDASGQLLGTRGAASIYSLQATKVATTGVGGLAGSADPRTAARLDATGRLPKALFPTLSDTSAALGLSQFQRLDAMLGRRRDIADLYFAQLTDLKAVLPSDVRHRSMFFRFPLRITRDIEETISQFAKRGVAARRGVDALLHRERNLAARAFAGAERLFRETLSIPIHPSMTKDEVDRVVAVCHDVLQA